MKIVRSISKLNRNKNERNLVCFNGVIEFILTIRMQFELKRFAFTNLYVIIISLSLLSPRHTRKTSLSKHCTYHHYRSTVSAFAFLHFPLGFISLHRLIFCVAFAFHITVELCQQCGRMIRFLVEMQLIQSVWKAFSADHESLNGQNI